MRHLFETDVAQEDLDALRGLPLRRCPGEAAGQLGQEPHVMKRPDLPLETFLGTILDVQSSPPPPGVSRAGQPSNPAGEHPPRYRVPP